jgi:hypothetical protein
MRLVSKNFASISSEGDEIFATTILATGKVATLNVTASRQQDRTLRATKPEGHNEPVVA